MAFADAKEQLIERISSILIAQGYSKNEEKKRQFIDRLRESLVTKTKLLSTEMAWNPDIFLVHENGTAIVADIQLLEERRPQYIPIAMEQAGPKIISNFDSVKVVLYIPMGGVLETDTIHKASKMNIAIEAIDKAGVIHRILEPTTVCQSHPTSTKEEIKTQKASGWVIPRILVEKLSNIKNLDYSRQLQQFATDYSKTSTPVRLSTQYKLAYRCIADIFKFYSLGLCCEGLQLSKDLQRMARRKGKSRDHFLHQFQTFLMGSLVLDNCAGSKSPFTLCKGYQKMDLPWLLASVFHDFGFDLANLDSCIDIGGIGEFRYESRGNIRYSALLNSLYDFQRNNGDIGEWDPDAYNVKSTDLGRILFDAAKEKPAKTTGERLKANHGVLSAHKIINFGDRLLESNPNLTPIFSSAALCVSVHDKYLWAELFSNAILPADAHRFPLLYLLMICDTLAEAGRPRTTKIGRQDAVLVDFNVQDNVINSIIWFSELERACTMNFWSRFVQERCFINPPLKLQCKCIL